MKYWIGVVSKEHVMRGVAGGFCQVCHGKAAPLNRMKKSDWLLYYSPTLRMCDAQKYQAFTAIGQITDDAAYPFPMSESFIPFRRDVDSLAIKQECTIDVVRQHLEWLHYARQLRYGHFEVSADFARLVQQHMLADARNDLFSLNP